VSAFASTNLLRSACRPARRLSALVLALVAFTAHDVAAQIVYAGSLRMATGTYLFTERTTGVVLLSAVEFGTGPVRASVSVPVISQSTTWISYLAVPVPSGGNQSAGVGEQIRRGAAAAGKGPGTVSAGTSGPSATLVSLPVEAAAGRTGVGDVIVRASYRATPDDASTAVRVHGAFKPALASVEDGFGTGASDSGVGVTVAHLAGRHQIAVATEFWHLGDMPGLPLNNTLAYRVGYDGFSGSSHWSASGAFSGWTTILDGVDPPMDISVGVTRHFSTTKRSVGATAAFGLTSSSPDVTVSLEWRLPF
jgi:hypothetical protein